MNTNHSPVKIIILLVVVLIGGYWFYSRSGASEGDGEFVDKVADKVLVPSDVSPKLIVLTTLEQLRGQSFFKQAALGDVIVMYPEHAILYRPSIDKVITIGAVNPTTSAQLFGTAAPAVDGAVPAVVPATGTVPATDGTVATTTPVVASTPVGVEIRNGTATSGLAKKLSEKLTVDTMVTVPATGNAGNNSYAKTTIVNLTGGELPASITATIQGAEVLTALPAGEKSLDTNAKVLVIIGADISARVPGL